VGDLPREFGSSLRDRRESKALSLDHLAYAEKATLKRTLLDCLEKSHPGLCLYRDDQNTEPSAGM
jgi:hypothetical protein